ncbi:hypothetical protein niasHS_010205 [Heterodera schachtii]|uniref:DNA ligase D polymerase domain-containing protein n=1 Tax=Heterodera schachtii TaxID=97005 RepID=A0ABD2J4L2_HETSC
MVKYGENVLIEGVEFSNPDKVFFPEMEFTKKEVAVYYQKIADRMLPLVNDRLVSVLRCPDGRKGKSFYEKHCRNFPDAMKLVSVVERTTGQKSSHACITGLASLIAGVQMGVLEFHIWGSRYSDLEHPDRIVMDIDPGQDVTFDEVKKAALDIKDRLLSHGLRSVPLLTGGKGVHVVAPVIPKADWNKVHDFTKAIAKQMEDDDPDRYISQSGKAKRKGRIFIDYLRNGRGTTAVAPYSTRNQKGAPVAAPVTWEELDSADRSNLYNVTNMVDRVKEKDPWRETHEWKQYLSPD